MNENFEQISLNPGFMKHNGGLLFKTISEKEYEFKTTISENHLNRVCEDIKNVGLIEQETEVEGRQLIMVVAPRHK